MLAFINRQNKYIFFWISKFYTSKFAKTCISQNKLSIIYVKNAFKYLENIPLILLNYRNLKGTKIVWFTIFFCFNCAINLNVNCRVISGKAKICLLNIIFLQKFMHKITTASRKSLFLRKNLTRKRSKYLFFIRFKSIRGRIA